MQLSWLSRPLLTEANLICATLGLLAAYGNLSLWNKIRFRIYVQLLKYFQVKLDGAKNTDVYVTISYSGIAMALFCLLVFIYLIVLQMTIIARSIEASYIDDSAASSGSEPEYTSSYPRSGFTQSHLTKTRYNPSYATSFKHGTRPVHLSGKTKSRRAYETSSLSMLRIVRARPTTVPTVMSTSLVLQDIDPPPTTFISAQSPRVTLSAQSPHLVTRKSLKSNASAVDLSASCLYYNGSGLSKQ